MKFNVFKILSASALAVSVSLLPAALPAAAQTDTNSTDTNSVTTPGERAQYNSGTADAGDRDFDWGWLGLLGLLGLAGLTKRNDEPVAYREPDVVSRTGYRE